MKRLLTVLICFLLSACATAKDAAIQTALIGKESADVFGEVWPAYVDYKIAHCRETLPAASSSDDRLACLGLAAKTEEAQIVVDGLTAANTAIYWAAFCSDRDGLPECVSDSNPDWQALLAEVSYWLPQLADFIRAAKEKR